MCLPKAPGIPERQGDEMAIGEVNPIALPMGLPGSAPAGDTRAPAPELAWPGRPKPLRQAARLPMRAGNNAKAQPFYAPCTARLRAATPIARSGSAAAGQD
jgi:hypothetical protein